MENNGSPVIPTKEESPSARTRHRDSLYDASKACKVRSRPDRRGESARFLGTKPVKERWIPLLADLKAKTGRYDEPVGTQQLV
jgi:hypothetical protein